jgi:hypothetical protein
MVDNYDRRTAGDEEPWQERQGEVMEPKKAVDDLVEALERDPDDVLDEVVGKARSLLGDLDAAESCDKETDFDANMQAAHRAVKELAELLKKTKAKAKKDELPDTVEILDEAIADLRGLARDIDELLPEG